MNKSLFLCLLVVGCASSAPETRSNVASANAVSAPRTAAGADCTQLCKSYAHYKRAALLECAEIGGCGSRSTNEETAEYGRELRDTLVGECGSACPEAAVDAKRATLPK
jgi:hypothetical protein